MGFQFIIGRNEERTKQRIGLRATALKVLFSAALARVERQAQREMILPY